MAELRQRTSTREQPPRRRSHPAERSEHEGQRPQAEGQRPEAEDRRPEAAAEPAPHKRWFDRIGRDAVGYVVVFVALAAYFVWLAAEMGGHALTGIGPLVMTFAATGAGVVLAGLALALARRDRGK